MEDKILQILSDLSIDNLNEIANYYSRENYGEQDIYFQKKVYTREEAIRVIIFFVKFTKQIEKTIYQNIPKPSVDILVKKCGISRDNAEKIIALQA